MAYLTTAQEVSFEIGLRPWEFWRMTPAEFSGTVRGTRKRDEREWERAAWQIHHLYALLSNRKRTPPTVDKLLGRKKKLE